MCRPCRSFIYPIYIYIKTSQLTERSFEMVMEATKSYMCGKKMMVEKVDLLGTVPTSKGFNEALVITIVCEERFLMFKISIF